MLKNGFACAVVRPGTARRKSLSIGFVAGRFHAGRAWNDFFMDYVSLSFGEVCRACPACFIVVACFGYES
jgi:hypothetical protein